MFELRKTSSTVYWALWKSESMPNISALYTGAFVVISRSYYRLTHLRHTTTRDQSKCSVYISNTCNCTGWFSGSHGVIVVCRVIVNLYFFHWLTCSYHNYFKSCLICWSRSRLLKRIAIFFNWMCNCLV